MKRLISFLASLSLLITSSTMIVSCNNTSWVISDAFDENNNNMTDKDSDHKQWFDIDLINISMISLSKKVFPDSVSFQQINDKSSNDLFENYFGFSKNDFWQFNYDFTFLITNYDSINKDVIGQIQTNNLADKDAGIYLFLNLPAITIDNIQNETDIDFQFLFMIKDSSGNIINNSNNNWFYWYDWNVINQPSNNSEYFFNFKDLKSNKKRIVTNFYPLK